MQKRRDIFVDSLVVIGYIVQNEDGSMNWPSILIRKD